MSKFKWENAKIGSIHKIILGKYLGEGNSNEAKLIWKEMHHRNWICILVLFVFFLLYLDSVMEDMDVDLEKVSAWLESFG